MVKSSTRKTPVLLESLHGHATLIYAELILICMLTLSIYCTTAMPLNHWKPGVFVDWDFKVSWILSSRFLSATTCIWLKSIFSRKIGFLISKRWRICCLLSYLASASSRWFLMCFSPLCWRLKVFSYHKNIYLL